VCRIHLTHETGLLVEDDTSVAEHTQPPRVLLFYVPVMKKCINQNIKTIHNVGLPSYDTMQSEWYVQSFHRKIVPFT
jgi:hypothetical protein